MFQPVKLFQKKKKQNENTPNRMFEIKMSLRVIHQYVSRDDK